VRIVVAEARVPGVRDGAQLHAQALAGELRQRGHDVETIALPFRGDKHALLDQASAWRLLELSSSNARPIDLLVATRFPTYFARHPRKVLWLMHQHRPAYELYGTAYSDFTDSAADRTLRERLMDLDRRMLAECSRIFTNARNTAQRLEKFNGVTGTPLYHPPPMARSLAPGPYEDYVLVVSRLEPLKRVDLAIAAMAHVPPPTRLVIVGEGSARDALQRAAAQSPAAGRIEFRGALWGEDVARLYSSALAVIYAPFDEDYGYVTLEAFLSAKPVITAADSGGPLEFVVNDESGFVCTADPASIGRAVSQLAADRATAERMGRAGLARARTVTWDGVVEQLLG
jgi:glycosyltransferase involved in cell wall biosynthesis